MRPLVRLCTALFVAVAACVPMSVAVAGSMPSKSTEAQFIKPHIPLPRCCVQ